MKLKNFKSPDRRKNNTQWINCFLDGCVEEEISVKWFF